MVIAIGHRLMVIGNWSISKISLFPSLSSLSFSLNGKKFQKNLSLTLALSPTLSVSLSPSLMVKFQKSSLSLSISLSLSQFLSLSL